MNAPLLQVENLRVDFPQGRGKVFQALKGVSFSIARGETVGLVGESGSGKTTIGKVILGQVAATAGRVVFDGEDITHATRARRRLHLALKACQRRRITTKGRCEHLHRHLSPQMPVPHPPHRPKAAAPNLPAKRQLRKQLHQPLRCLFRLHRGCASRLRIVFHYRQSQQTRLTPGEGVFGS